MFDCNDEKAMRNIKWMRLFDTEEEADEEVNAGEPFKMIERNVEGLSEKEKKNPIFSGERRVKFYDEISEKWGVRGEFARIDLKTLKEQNINYVM